MYKIGKSLGIFTLLTANFTSLNTDSFKFSRNVYTEKNFLRIWYEVPLQFS